MQQTVLLLTGKSHTVQDLKHFMLKCPACDSIRSGCRAFLLNVYSLPHDLGGLFGGHICTSSHPRCSRSCFWWMTAGLAQGQ